MAGHQWEDSRVVRILDHISVPAAPFRETLVEHRIQDVIKPLCSGGKIQCFKDRIGNIVVNWMGADSPRLPCLALAAHMDHPGYEIIEISGNMAIARVLGGLFNDARLVGSGVLLVSDREMGRGTITDVTDKGKDDRGRGICQVRIQLETPLDIAPETVFGVPDVERFKVSGELVHGRAMDDLAGCAIQLAVLERVVQENIPVDLTLVFHRAEEVGFLGAIGSCEFGNIPRNAALISLEASKNLAGARPGDGIVIRTGDRLYRYDPNTQQLMEQAASALMASGWKVQKRLMDGGVSEATPYLSYGYETTGLAVPLINYHNQGDGRVEAEAVHMYDLNSAVELLCMAAGQMVDGTRVPMDTFRRDCHKRFYESFDKLIR